MEDGVEVEAAGGAAAGGRGSSEGGYSHMREMGEGATVWAPFAWDFHRGLRPLTCDVDNDVNLVECARRRATTRRQGLVPETALSAPRFLVQSSCRRLASSYIAASRRLSAATETQRHRRRYHKGHRIQSVYITPLRHV